MPERVHFMVRMSLIAMFMHRNINNGQQNLKFKSCVQSPYNFYQVPTDGENDCGWQSNAS
jgi:hypothetical protein